MHLCSTCITLALQFLVFRAALTTKGKPTQFRFQFQFWYALPFGFGSRQTRTFGTIGFRSFVGFGRSLVKTNNKINSFKLIKITYFKICNISINFDDWKYVMHMGDTIFWSFLPRSKKYFMWKLHFMWSLCERDSINLKITISIH